jgi:hypothetical protein
MFKSISVCENLTRKKYSHTVIDLTLSRPKFKADFGSKRFGHYFCNNFLSKMP